MKLIPFRPLFALVLKDVRVFMSDRYGLLLSYIAPIFLASFMAVIFGGSGSAPHNPIALKLVDEDRSQTSKAIIARAMSEEMLAVEVLDKTAAIAAVRQGEAAFAVTIPEGFGAMASEAMTGQVQAPELVFIQDPTHSSELSLAKGLLSRIILETVATDAFTIPEADRSFLGDDLLAIAQEIAPGSISSELQEQQLLPGTEHSSQDELDSFAVPFPGAVENLDSISKMGLGELSAKRDPLVQKANSVVTEIDAASHSKFSVPYVCIDQSIVAGGAEGERVALAAHAFASMIVQFVLFSAVEWGVCLLIERKTGLWKRLRSAPISRWTLIFAKMISCAIMSLSIIGVVLAFGSMVFGYSLSGHATELILLSGSFAVMASTFGIMVAAFGRSPQGARAVSVLSVLVMVLLGGGWIPSFLFPNWLQKLTPAVPTRWVIDGFDAILSRGFTVQELVPTLVMIWVFTIGFGLVGSITCRWSSE